MLAIEIDSSERNATRCDLCPLNRVKTGIAVRVKKLLATPETAQRLREIGFCEESVVELLTSQTNIICLVCNARLALSTALAESILVEPVPAFAVA
jgi:Fe2+ transport system protein FeoA